MTNVLVVDDSAVVRQAMAAILAPEGFRVRVAPDPVIALSKLNKPRPDVILLDIVMPRMNGLAFLRKVMSDDPIPVVICSALAARGTDIALQALEEGAVDIVAKPSLGVRDFLHESAQRLVDALRGAAQARPRRRLPIRSVGPRLTADAVLPLRLPPSAVTTDKVIAIGASTGGTEALRAILGELPPDAPGLVVVQHMLAPFVVPFADRLQHSCRVRIKVAEPGDRVIQGRVLIAPGNRHLLVRRRGGQYIVELDDGPPVGRHRPSVDVLFRSVAQSAAANAVGLILTGMGDDGATGLLEMRGAGAWTIAQDEATSVVYGMPKVAADMGAACEIMSLPRMAGALVQRAAAAAGA